MEKGDQSKDRLRRLASELRSREETTRSIELASTRQRSMLPPPPHVEGYDFQAYYQPAANVSGDFYDFFWTRENRRGPVVGDVSGHGIEAGIIMGRAMATVNIYGRQFDSPRKVLELANADLYRVLDGKTFISLCYCVLDARARKLLIASAGGVRPIFFNAASGDSEPVTVKTKGVVLGADSGERFNKILQEVEIELYPGDLLLFYTDGIIEAENEAEEMYGTEKLEQVVMNMSSTVNAEEIIETILQNVASFVGDAQQYDDMTVVVIKKL